MRLLTWNICRDDLPVAGVSSWAKRRESAFEFIRSGAPSIVALQEATPRQLRDLDLNLRPYKRAANSSARSIHTHRNAIYYDPREVKVLDSGYIPIAGYPSTVDTITTPRTANWISVEVEGRRVTIASVHLDPVSASARAEAALQLVDAFPDAIIVGDFNERPDSDVYCLFRRKGWEDVWSFANDELHFGTFHFRGRETRARPDWMLIPPRWQGGQSGCVYAPFDGDQQIGDHSALLAEVHFSPEMDEFLSRVPTPEELATWEDDAEFERMVDEHLALLEGRDVQAPQHAEATNVVGTSDRFERLRAWRLRQAKSEGVPAYVVAQDSILRTIAALCPSSIHELRRIKGIGPARSERYGASILAILAEG